MNHVIAPAHSDARSGALIWAWFGAWLALATGVAASGLLTLERRLLVPISIFGLSAALVVAYHRSERFGPFARGVDLRVPLLVHAVRAPVGAAFLWLASRGQLDAEFARVAGWGDIVAGLGALVAAAAAPIRSPARRRLVLAWNTIGLLDILLVVATAQRILVFSGHPETMRGLMAFPGPLLPTFLVPLVITTHLLIFARARAADR